MDTNPWLSAFAILVPATASILVALVARNRADDDDEELPAAPGQPAGTWSVSPEMYRWFQDQMSALHTRMRVLEDAERESRSRADRTDRLLGLALDHISAQDEQLRAAGLPLIPMDPELVAARDSR
ncbi:MULTISPECIES: hypothetical protein [Streptomyces]|uniref:Uncharacterized protein n=1 Tax=Streptomyces doudnae TaxID=3075536 RepID=A0ABD5EPG1_9ACTN|nr:MULTISPECIES: hypothetical protein [unclassified Streptomyces]MDT0435594.1 hypothetical protein [Streptomyces sp. DSM 41981]MYQ62549.1 hypothetical protein [Streptomyces sp. SID4950]SCD39786.1 hypothetical protein GA0115242_104853 [Streptomyces sp. SolWspMP-5a-2]